MFSPLAELVCFMRDVSSIVAIYKQPRQVDFQAPCTYPDPKMKNTAEKSKDL